MSLPKTLKLAEKRLDAAEETLQLHAEELVSAVTGDREYRGLHEEKAASEAASASLQAFNAKQQFSAYKEDFEQAVNGEKVAEELMNEHDIAANMEQYSKAYSTAEQVALRHERLHRQIKGLSQVMEENDLGDLWEDIQDERPWYRAPGTSHYAKKAFETV